MHATTWHWSGKCRATHECQPIMHTSFIHSSDRSMIIIIIRCHAAHHLRVDSPLCVRHVRVNFGIQEQRRRRSLPQISITKECVQIVRVGLVDRTVAIATIELPNRLVVQNDKIKHSLHFQFESNVAYKMCFLKSESNNCCDKSRQLSLVCVRHIDWLLMATACRGKFLNQPTWHNGIVCRTGGWMDHAEPIAHFNPFSNQNYIIASDCVLLYAPFIPNAIQFIIPHYISGQRNKIDRNGDRAMIIIQMTNRMGMH